MSEPLHILKLSVGSESVEQILDWQRNRSRQRAGGHYYHLTRMWPKRTDEVLDGGSIYWVVQGLVQCRQRILGFEEIIGQDGIRRCGIVLDPEIIRTDPAPKRPFQGWRYLKNEDAPRDLKQDAAQKTDPLPASLLAALSDLGVR